MKPKSNPSQKSEIFGNFQWEHQLPSHVVPKSLGISSCARTQTCIVHFPLQLFFWPNFNFYSRIVRKVGRHWMDFSETRFQKLFPKVWSVVNPKILGICPNFQNRTWSPLFPLQYLFLPISKFYWKVESIGRMNFIEFLGLGWISVLDFLPNL